MVIWGGLTMCTAAAKHPRDIMAIRFFQGMAESSTFVGTHYILGSWYVVMFSKQDPLFRRFWSHADQKLAVQSTIDSGVLASGIILNS